MIGPVGKTIHKVGGAKYYLLRDDEELPEGFLVIDSDFMFPASMINTEHRMFMMEGSNPSYLRPLETLTLVLEMEK